MKEEIPAGYLRVTEVLSPFSPIIGLDKEMVAKAADRGTRVHHYCESHALGLFVEDIDEDCKNYVMAFKEWFDEMVVDIIHTEIRLNSPSYRISGAFDLLCVLKGDEHPTLIDYKTPQAESPTWALQTAAYQLLCLESLNIVVPRRIVLQLPKNEGRAKVIEYKDHGRDQDLYLKALELYRYFKG